MSRFLKKAVLIIRLSSQWSPLWLACAGDKPPVPRNLFCADCNTVFVLSERFYRVSSESWTFWIPHDNMRKWYLESNKTRHANFWLDNAENCYYVCLYKKIVGFCVIKSDFLGNAKTNWRRAMPSPCWRQPYQSFKSWQVNFVHIYVKDVSICYRHCERKRSNLKSFITTDCFVSPLLAMTFVCVRFW